MTRIISVRAVYPCLFLLFAIACSCPSVVRADSAPTASNPTLPFVHPLFADNMVLQRDAMDRVWGWTTPGATVTVSLSGKTATAVAGGDGKWIASIGKFKAGGPYDLSITGPHTVTLHNVMIGDVWICSGQSNMELGVAGAKDGPAEVAAANFPNIRLFIVGHVIGATPQALLGSNSGQPPAAPWQICSPQTVGSGGWGGFSAVGYYFGRSLYQRLHVAIGLIQNPWSGMPAEAFVSAGSLDRMADFQDSVRAEQETAAGTFSETAFGDAVDRWAKANDPGSQGAQTWADPALDDSGWATMSLPGMWSSKGVAALAKFDGVMWYRTTFDAPAAWAGKDVVLHLGPIADDDTTYVNGVRVGSRGYWTLQRDYTVRAELIKSGTNSIAIRIIDNNGNGGLWNASLHLSIGPVGDQAGAVSLSKDWKYKASIPWAGLPAPPVMVDLTSPSTPTVLWNGMVKPLVPFAIKGVIWYQGESNASRAYEYRTLLPTLITDWRTQFGQGDFPFLVVQLAAFRPYGQQQDTSEWAQLREAQLMTAQRVPNVGMAVTIDIGDPNDVHPRDKQDVGKRLALAAMHVAYGMRDEYWGPTYESMTMAGEMVRIKFGHTAGGLRVTGDKLTGFTMAGGDHNFVPVDAALGGKDTVVLTVPPTIAKPAAVRYAFESYPTVDLYNGVGLPASPFRTDVGP